MSGVGGAGSVHPAGQPMTDYTPSVVAPFNTENFDDGSFEQGPGFGWDRCYTRTPGAVIAVAQGGSEGSRFMELVTAPCEATCASDPRSRSQLYLWFGESGHPTEPSGIYVDFSNLDATPPSGKLQLFAVNSVCDAERQLLELPLEALMLRSSWSTRCFDASFASDESLGLAVVGPRYHLGIDGVRLGPPCH